MREAICSYGLLLETRVLTKIKGSKDNGSDCPEDVCENEGRHPPIDKQNRELTSLMTTNRLSSQHSVFETSFILVRICITV